MMKRIIAILLVIIMLLTLAACSRTSNSQPDKKFSETNYSETADVTSGKNNEESDDNTTDCYDESVDSKTSSDKIVADDVDTSEKEETKSTEKQPSLEGTEQTEPPRATEEATPPKITQNTTTEDKKAPPSSTKMEETKPSEPPKESTSNEKNEEVTTPKETEGNVPPEKTPSTDEQQKDDVEETKPTESFDIATWVSYAKAYAQSKGLHLDQAAVDCWDNPIRAGAHCIYLERDIQSRLNRYAKDEDITDVWIWAESVGNGCYDIYIGYA